MTLFHIRYILLPLTLGSVIRCTDMRHSVVEYDELGKQKVPTRFVIPMSGAISVPHLVVSRIVYIEYKCILTYIVDQLVIRLRLSIKKKSFSCPAGG